MTIKINAAYRVKAILEKSKQQPNRNVGEHWADIFGINENIANTRNVEVSRCLSQLHDEIGIIKQQMDNTDFSDDLYSSYLNIASHVVGVQNISGNWDSYKSQISNEQWYSVCT